MEIGSYDIETFEDVNDENKHIPYCVCFYFKENSYSIYYKKNSDIILTSLFKIFKKMSKTDEKNSIFYIHNLNYDGLFLLHTLTKNKFLIETFIEKTDIYSIIVFYGDMRIHFKCSYKILPSSLKKISESFNLEKKLPFPYKIIKKNILFSKNISLSDSDFIDGCAYSEYIGYKGDNLLNVRRYSTIYCTRDTLIVVKFIKILRNMIFSLKIDLYKEFSAPSLALKIFIKQFNKNKISFSDKKLLDNFLRPSYFGGRCEVYGNPDSNEFIYHYDFPGMYGQCMSEKFPFGKWVIDEEINDFRKPGFYSIDYTSNSYIPILPTHHPSSGKLLFLNGSNLKGWFYFEEIIHFVENGGTVNKIINSITFENYDYVFKEYVEFFNNFREKGDDFKTFGKLMINSLYGRMGMQNKNSYTFFTTPDKLNFFLKNGTIVSIKEMNELYLIELEIEENKRKKLNLRKNNIKNNVFLASAITSKARVKLNRAQLDIIANKGRVLYSDTDSVFAAYARDITDEKHGSVNWEWGKKDTKIKDAFFINPKSYGLKYFDEKEVIKIKGLNRKNVNFDELKMKFYQNDTLIVENISFLDKKDLTIKTSNVEKRYDLSQYDKRKFIYNKKETNPFNYEELIFLQTQAT